MQEKTKREKDFTPMSSLSETIMDLFPGKRLPKHKNMARFEQNLMKRVLELEEVQEQGLDGWSKKRRKEVSEGQEQEWTGRTKGKFWRGYVMVAFQQNPLCRAYGIALRKPIGETVETRGGIILHPTGYEEATVWGAIQLLKLASEHDLDHLDVLLSSNQRMKALEAAENGRPKRKQYEWIYQDYLEEAGKISVDYYRCHIAESNAAMTAALNSCREAKKDWDQKEAWLIARAMRNKRREARCLSLSEIAKKVQVQENALVECLRLHGLMNIDDFMPTEKAIQGGYSQSVASYATSCWNLAKVAGFLDATKNRAGHTR